MLGHELISGVEAAAHKLCKSLGLQPVQIVWTTDIQTAAINSKGNMLLHDVALDAPVSKAMFHRYVGFVVHELLHRKYTDFSVRGKGKYLSTLHNAVEDIWIERMAVKQGLTGNIEGLLSELIDGMVTEALAAVKDWTDPAQYPFALAVYGRRYAVRQVPLAQGLERIFSEASCRIDNCLNSTDTLAVAQWVLDELKLPEPKKQPEQEQEQAGKKGEQGKGKEKGDGQGKGKEQGQEQGDGDGEGEGEGEEQGEGEGSGAGAGAGEGEEQGQGEGEGAGEGSGAGEAGEAAGEAAGEGEGEGDKPGERKQVGGAESPAKEVEPGCPVAGDPGPGGKFDRGRAEETWGNIYGGHAWPTATASCGKIRNEIKRLLENTGRSDWSPHRKAGSLNVRALPSISTGNVNLFKRRDEVEGVDSAVLILLDNSGSMEYVSKYSKMTRVEAAVPVVVALHAAATAAGASVAVDAFSIATTPIVGWGAPTAKLATLINKIDPNYNTNDYQAVRLAGDKLLARPEQRKVLIVITDGNGDRERTAKHVASLERCGVTVIGVGIMLDSEMTDVYPSSISVKNLQDLASASFKHIKVAMA